MAKKANTVVSSKVKGRFVWSVPWVQGLNETEACRIEARLIAGPASPESPPTQTTQDASCRNVKVPEFAAAPAFCVASWTRNSISGQFGMGDWGFGWDGPCEPSCSKWAPPRSTAARQGSWCPSRAHRTAIMSYPCREHVGTSERRGHMDHGCNEENS